MESFNRKTDTTRARSLDRKRMLTVKQTNGIQNDLAQYPDIKGSASKIIDYIWPPGVPDGTTQEKLEEISFSTNMLFKTKQNIEQLKGLLKLSNQSQQVTSDAIAIFEACFFFIYDKLIPTWQRLEFELKLRGNGFLEELDSFDKLSLVTKRIDERDFRRIKAAIESVNLEDAKKNPYYSLLQGLKAWATSLIKFYDEWQATFESYILQAK